MQPYFFIKLLPSPQVGSKHMSSLPRYVVRVANFRKARIYRRRCGIRVTVSFCSRYLERPDRSRRRKNHTPFVILRTSLRTCAIDDVIRTALASPFLVWGTFHVPFGLVYCAPFGFEHFVNADAGH